MHKFVVNNKKDVLGTYFFRDCGGYWGWQRHCHCETGHSRSHGILLDRWRHWHVMEDAFLRTSTNIHIAEVDWHVQC